MSDSRERTPPPRRTPVPGRDAHEDPFTAHQTSLPAWRVRLPLPVHQKRILLLFVIALVLAVIGALVGTRLFSRPRQVRSTVTADLRILDARISEVVSCLGGPGARVDEGKLTRRILERALAEESWPLVAADCRGAAMQLYAATSAIMAASQAVAGRVPEPMQRRYRQAQNASERLFFAVGRLVEDVHRGQRLPAMAHADGVTRALTEVQAALGALERLAGFSNPRSAPQPSADTRPPWPEAARLAADLRHGPMARLEPFGESEGRRALRLLDPGADAPVRLLLRPLDDAQWLSLPLQIAPQTAPKEAAGDGATARPAPAPPSTRDPTLRWLDVESPEGQAPAPVVLYARTSWDLRAARASIHLGHFPPGLPEIHVPWAPLPGAATTALAGMARSPERLVILGAPQGLGLVLAQLRSRDGGKTWERPLVLAQDGDPRLAPQLHVTEATEPILSYAVRQGGTALQVLPAAGDAAPTRVVLQPGPPTPIRSLCRAATGRVYLLDGLGRPWVGALPAGPFVPLRPGAPGAALPGLRAPRTVRLACFEGKAALAWSEGQGVFHYTTCDKETCGRHERVSFSRLDDVLLAATRRSVLVLARDPLIIFQRRDPGATGVLASARPVAHVARPVQAWRLVPGRDSQRLALLLLDGGLARLRTSDGGRRWLGE